MNHEDEMRRDEQILDFLFDELGANERDDFEAAIDVDAALSNELAGLGTVVALLESAPEAIWGEDEAELPVLDAVAIGTYEPPHDVSVNGGRPRSEPHRGRGRFARLMDMLGTRPVLAGALTVLIFILGAGVGLLAAGDDGGVPQPGGGATPTLVLKAVNAPNGEAAGKMWWNSATRTMRFEFDGLERLPRGEYYETWISKGGGDGEEEVSLGAFVTDADGGASLTTPVPVDPAQFTRIEVTRERADGNPASSGIVVLGARLSSAARRAINGAVGDVQDSADAAPRRADDRSSGDKRQSSRDGGGDNGSGRGNQSPSQQADPPTQGDNGSGDAGGETNPSDEPGSQDPEPVPPLLPLPLPPLPLPEQPILDDPLLDSLTGRIERLPQLGQTDR